MDWLNQTLTINSNIFKMIVLILLIIFITLFISHNLSISVVKAIVRYLGGVSVKWT